MTLNHKMEIVKILVWLFYAYLLIGLVFAFWFAFNGVKKVDDGMRSAKWNLRLLLVPGTMLLWIFMLKKYLKS